MKYFCFSDVHGDFDAMIHALDREGYDKKNPKHRIISCGDHFGRADASNDISGSKKVFEYLTSRDHVNMPICLRGNHEDILLNIFKYEHVSYIDELNGEDKTCISFMEDKRRAFELYSESTAHEHFKYIKKSGLKDWIISLPYYYETATHILFHGWGTHNLIPESIHYKWEDAIWAKTPNDIERYREAFPKYDKHKTIVFGHWGVQHLRKELSLKNDENSLFGLWVDKDFKLIGLDGTTAFTHNQLIYIFEEGET